MYMSTNLYKGIVPHKFLTNNPIEQLYDYQDFLTAQTEMKTVFPCSFSRVCSDVTRS